MNRISRFAFLLLLAFFGQALAHLLLSAHLLPLHFWKTENRRSGGAISWLSFSIFHFRFSIFEFPVSLGAAAMKDDYGLGLCTVKSKSRAGKGGL
jgi:hypothetical protein